MVKSLTLKSSNKYFTVKSLTHYQCCGSWMFIPDPDFCPSGSRIEKQQQKRRVKKIFFVTTNITNLKIILFLNWCKKNLGRFTKEYRTF